MGRKGKTKSDYSGAGRGAGRQQQSWGALCTVCGCERWDYDTEYQKLLDKAKAQRDEAAYRLDTATMEYTKAAIEHDRCQKTFFEAVRARPRLPADGGGGDGMELDGQWEPLLATLSVEQFYERARGSSTQRRRPGPYSSSDHAKQERGRMAAGSGQRVAEEKTGEGKAGGAESSAAGGQQ